MNKDVGKWSFLVAFVGAIIFGLLAFFDVLMIGVVASAILVLSGVVAGFLNIRGGESVKFMVGALVLGASAGILALVPVGGALLKALASTLVLSMLPMGIVVAVKQLWKTGKN